VKRNGGEDNRVGQLDASSRDNRPTSVRWYVFGLIGAASWLLYLHRYAWGVVKVDYKSEHPELTATQLGWLDSAFLATYALGQVPGGLAADVFGPRLVLGLSILLWSVTLAGLTWASGFWPLFAMLAAFGLSQAGAYPAISKVSRSWFPPTIRTGVQGIVTSLGRAGAACASVTVATLLIGLLGLSWRSAVVIIAMPGILLAAAFWIVFRNSPREHPWTNRAEQDEIEPTPGDLPDARPFSPGPSTTNITSSTFRVTASPPSERGNAPPLIGNRPAHVSLAMLLVYAFCSTFADMLYVFWIPSFLVDGKGLGRIDMGWLAMLPLLGGAAGGVVGGVLNDALRRATGGSRWARSGVAFTGKFLAAVLIVVSLEIPDGRLVMVLLLACKFFGDWSLPTQWGTITDIAGKGAGTVFGIVNTVGSIGGFVAGPVLGYLKENHGWEGLFLGVGAAYLAAAACWLFIDCNARLRFAKNDRET
jgi:ACS family glucarate transporter-like MFS transporter